MEFISRFVKGVIGVVILTVLFGLLMLPIEISVLGIDPTEHVGMWIGMVAAIIGGVLGWKWLSKAKWLTVLVVFVVGFVVGGFLNGAYPDGYSGSQYNYSAEVDGVSMEGAKSVAKYTNGLLTIFTVLKGPEQKGIIVFVNASRPGVYMLNSTAGPNYSKGNHGQYDYGGKENLTNFLSDGHNSGKCEITMLDLNNKKVSGTFEFEAIQFTSSGFGTRVVRITKGKFENVPIKE